MKLDPQKFALAGTTAYMVYILLLLIVPTLIPIHGLTAAKIDNNNFFSIVIMTGINYVFYFVLAHSYNKYTHPKKKR